MEEVEGPDWSRDSQDEAGPTTTQPTNIYRNRPAANGDPDDRQSLKAHRQGPRSGEKLAQSATAAKGRNGDRGDDSDDAWDLNQATSAQVVRSSGSERNLGDQTENSAA